MRQALACTALLLSPALAQTGASADRVSLPSGPGSLQGLGSHAQVAGNLGAMQHGVSIAVPAGFYDGAEKQFRGYGRVEERPRADMNLDSQESGLGRDLRSHPLLPTERCTWAACLRLGVRSIVDAAVAINQAESNRGNRCDGGAASAIALGSSVH